MNIKQGLAQYRQCFQTWISLIEEEEKLRSLSEKITASLNGMPGGTGDRPGKVGLVLEGIEAATAPIPKSSAHRTRQPRHTSRRCVPCRGFWPLAASGVQMAVRKRDLWEGAKTLVIVSRARKTAVVGGPRSGCG